MAKRRKKTKRQRLARIKRYIKKLGKHGVSPLHDFHFMMRNAAPLNKAEAREALPLINAAIREKERKG
jgi:hypothetical protein